eukprot:TRINITY_DN25625_c0_g1_i1.p2 TRINITY_DN25625_c0_g1~~TRINITY_DN25625_c0_g1_i1.p2  ORF type:complete len:102 (+),score=14.45 TRINITY_DN25625_c0_g1_i1:298-603(+)
MNENGDMAPSISVSSSFSVALRGRSLANSLADSRWWRTRSKRRATKLEKWLKSESDVRAIGNEEPGKRNELATDMVAFESDLPSEAKLSSKHSLSSGKTTE